MSQKVHESGRMSPNILEGQMTADSGKWARVTAAFSEALELATEIGMAPLAARCHAGLAIVYTRMSRHDAACSAVSCGPLSR